jgi:cytochrome c-type biogenesis protein CcmH
MKPTTKLALCALLAFGLSPWATAQSDRDARVKRIGKRLMCLCGCNQVLVECNHVGCSVSAEMIKKLEQRVERNEPEDLTLQSFVQEYGQRVLAEPPTKGFSQLAWYMPIAAVLLGLVIVRAVLLRMRAPAVAAAAGGGLKVSAEALDRFRHQADRESEE